jgi:hypothetical protein
MPLARHAATRFTQVFRSAMPSTLTEADHHATTVLTQRILLYTESTSSDPRPNPVPGASGTVHHETPGEGGIRMHVDASLQDGTTVRGSLDMTWCELML